MTCVPLSTTVVYWTMNQSSQVVAATNRERDRQTVSFVLSDFVLESSVSVMLSSFAGSYESISLDFVSSGRNKKFTNQQLVHNQNHANDNQNDYTQSSIKVSRRLRRRIFAPMALYGRIQLIEQRRQLRRRAEGDKNRLQSRWACLFGCQC